MIAFVRGRVAAVTLSSAVLEVGGIGLEVMCTPEHAGHAAHRARRRRCRRAWWSVRTR